MTKFYFNPPLGPTEYNLKQTLITLGWHENDLSPFISDKNLLKDKQLEVFEHKHQLARWSHQHELKFTPQTFIVDELNIHQVLQQLENSEDKKRWILKPALLNNGKGLSICCSLNEIDTFFRSTERYGGKYILQQYLEPPLLFETKKFSLRVFVILTNQSKGYLYKHGYLNICQTPYQHNCYMNLNSHLTNEYLNDDGSLNNSQFLSSKWPVFDKVLPMINKQCLELFKPWLAQTRAKQEIIQYGVLGLDFMLTDDFNLWLLEVNHGPCFPKNDDHPLFNYLYKPFWRHIVDEIILQGGKSIQHFNLLS